MSRHILFYIINCINYIIINLQIKSINEQFSRAEIQNNDNSRALTYIKTLVRNVLKKQFDPPISLKSQKGRICQLQFKSVVEYLRSGHCN